MLTDSELMLVICHTKGVETGDIFCETSPRKPGLKMLARFHWCLFEAMQAVNVLQVLQILSPLYRLLLIYQVKKATVLIHRFRFLQEKLRA